MLSGINGLFEGAPSVGGHPTNILPLRKCSKNHIPQTSEVKLPGFAEYRTCYWCSFPLPDCTCPVARRSYSPVNDNEVYQ